MVTYVYYVPIFFRNEDQVFQAVEENIVVLRHDTLGITWNGKLEFSVHSSLLAQLPQAGLNVSGTSGCLHLKMVIKNPQQLCNG